MTKPQTSHRGRGLLLATTVALAGMLVFAGTASAAPTLSPASSTATVGQSVTITATGVARVANFTITSGPNAGTTQRVFPDGNGNATFTYSSSLTGTDHVSATDATGTSNDVTVTWTSVAAPPPPPEAKSDVQVTLTTVPSIARVGAKATWVATLANAGPDAATGVSFQATGPAGATLVSATASRGNGCTASTCAIGTLDPGASATVTVVYTLGQAGSLTFTASIQADFDTNSANNTATAATTVLQPGQPPPPPPPPSQPGTFNAIPTGTVLVNGSAVPADQLFVLKSGDTVDVTDGIITFTVADGSTGNFSATQPTARRSVSAVQANLPAVFTIQQPASGGTPTLTLTGGDFSTCTSPRTLSASTKPIRALWGSAKGNFTTKGRYAAASVRGTIWLTEDRCDGTLTQVVEGVIGVFDSTRNTTVTVNAGGSYVAAPRPALKLPTQSAALVQKRGLLYGGRIYKTKAAFTKRLKTIRYSWADFAKKYPKQAAALARRR